ncbi:hypothetical protein PHLCEN_2v1495 [Hermanssonia centrifuga]|uniref:Uncharacterized protein n=1 Tax=Hermanssonia centrifuga TaxID=98765 RepID=A0A2R6RZR8_9APHY|nr:hypothetical protein PHLCEN_2v1495 [Hermanssonia centrifuga]
MDSQFGAISILSGNGGRVVREDRLDELWQTERPVPHSPVLGDAQTNMQSQLHRLQEIHRGSAVGTATISSLETYD